MGIHVDIKRAQDIIDLFDATPRQAKIVLWRAITRAATAAQTRASVNTRKKYHVAAADVRKSLRIRKKSVTTLNANLRSEGNAIPLINFDTTPNEPSQDLVYTRVLRRGGKRFVPGAFVKKAGRTGNPQVMTRLGASRRPLKVLYGPSIPQMIASEDIMDDIVERANQVLNDRLDHEIERLLRGDF